MCSEHLAHKPALLNETLSLLALAPGKVIVDCTVGAGGHAKAALEHIMPGGFLRGMDKDRDALSAAGEALKDCAGSFKLIHADFINIE